MVARKWHFWGKKCRVYNLARPGSYDRLGSPMMKNTSAHLHSIAEHLAILTKKLRECTDPVERRVLLKEFRVLLGEADKISAEQIQSE